MNMLGKTSTLTKATFEGLFLDGGIFPLNLRLP